MYPASGGRIVKGAIHTSNLAFFTVFSNDKILVLLHLLTPRLSLGH